MRSRSAVTYSALMRSRLMAWLLSFWMTTSTGRMPYLYGLFLPNAGRASSSETNTCAATVTFALVWRALYSVTGFTSNFSVSLSAANAAAILMNRKRRLKTKGIYLLYRALQILGLPFLLFYFL